MKIKENISLLSLTLNIKIDSKNNNNNKKVITFSCKTEFLTK